MYIPKLHHFSNTMMAQGCTENAWEITNYERFINQFPPDIIRSIRHSKGLTKIYRQNMSIMFNQICNNEEMLPIYIYIYIYSPTLMGLSALAKELMVATSVKQGSSNELSPR